jgi:putative lipoprotein
MKRKFLVLGLVILSMVAMSLSACAGQTSAKTGTMQVYVTDAPPKGVTAIEIKASNVEAHLAGAADDQWVSLLKDPPTFDLVKATGVNVLLGTSDVAAGKYTQVRLDITDVTVTLNGTQVKATVPSDKLKLVGEITVEEGKQTPISLDFDAEKSIVLEGQNKVSLKPVVKLIVAKPGESLATPTSTPTTTTQTSTPTTTQTSTAAANAGIAEVRATDAPPTGISKILVTAKDIQVHKADAAADSWITVVSTEKTFDLVAIQGAEISLGQENLTPGTYTQVRLDVTKVVVTKDGKDITAKLPGDKIKIVTPFEIKTGEKTVLTLDFEADKFVVMTSADAAQVKPVIRLGVTQGDRPLKTKSDTNKVSGTVTYAESVTLDPAAVVTVKLLDITKPDAPVVVGQQTITAGGSQVPFSYEIDYASTAIKASDTYSIQADITLNGQKLFTTDKDYLVITKGNPSTIDITLKKV